MFTILIIFLRMLKDMDYFSTELIVTFAIILTNLSSVPNLSILC